MKVALVHDWLVGMRGGEKVLEVICELYPHADMFTLLHVKGSVSGIIESRKIVTSFLQRLPFAKRNYRRLLPLFPLAIESFDLSGYDLVISSSHAVAKGVIPAPGALHISYVHTPMRYVWDKYNDYFGTKKGIAAAAISSVAHYLRNWDAAANARVDYFIANSRHVAKRIERYYGRPAAVIHPPVDCARFSPGRGEGGYYLIVSAFAPYKRIDIAIEAFNRSGKKLLIIGSGQCEKKLKAAAKGNIEFIGWKKDSELASYYAGCSALIFPGEEDFGIVPLEAMASGNPVIAFGEGGALETVVPPGAAGHATGLFFSEQTPESLHGAVEMFEKTRAHFDPYQIREHSLVFDRSVFRRKIKMFIEEKISERLSGKYAEKTQPAF